MTNISRRYYERELGAGMGPSPTIKEAFGYSEPLRRFIQRESFEPQANEIPNTMPSWLPGNDYMTDFKKGDPYVKIDDGYARLPGAGYEAIHPELKGVAPEDYPDIHKLRILSDVAPYSREYNQVFPSCLTPKASRTRVSGDPRIGLRTSLRTAARTFLHALMLWTPRSRLSHVDQLVSRSDAPPAPVFTCLRPARQSVALAYHALHKADVGLDERRTLQCDGLFEAGQDSIGSFVADIFLESNRLAIAATYLVC
jgi:hypothetical protein